MRRVSEQVKQHLEIRDTVSLVCYIFYLELLPLIKLIKKVRIPEGSCWVFSTALSHQQDTS